MTDKTSNFDTKAIYAYQSNDGGIYKTMELSLIGNCDSKKYNFPRSERYYGFVRIDNECGYCQFMFHTLDEVFEHHFKSNHKLNKIFQFKTQEDFFKWCLSLPKQYGTGSAMDFDDWNKMKKAMQSNSWAN